ncbi:MAG: beta-ketoacyl-[acyl-carrier-protein] synthase family protein [Planctomycetia bacterium]|nr:beta-ketoacyl-[acyl-carrier-protein] synthase family protein [Planctomycetia bacterium]RLT12495.1 MAG: beta-ketoacyl-[acyl-carrier-protein] synthase family protein [Planctomycetota bacterium]
MSSSDDRFELGSKKVSQHNAVVCITGIGAASPLGHSFAAIADNLLQGRSAVQQVSAGVFARDQIHFAAPVIDIPLPPGMNEQSFASLGKLHQLCLSPAAHALADAGLTTDRRGMRIGIVLGIAAEHMKVWELDFVAGGTRVLQPELDAESIVHSLQRDLAIDGPAVTVAAACASSGFAMALGRKWLRAGWVDACIVGGCDVLSPTAFAAFYNLRALSRRSDDPAKASRPFDRDRDGFVMGEGGAFFVLECESKARARGATIYGELAGVGMSSDASHMVIPSADPKNAAHAIRLALQDASINPEDVDYINAHAAGTAVGDVAEAGAIRMAFGEKSTRVPVSSTKSMSGHLLSGASAFEAIACLTAIRHRCVPPTLNLDHPDEQCVLAHVANAALDRPVRIAASNSFGFGGANLCLVIRAAA